ncbi:MAG: efflux RND transporter periplasmic adaptor subunit [Muribaculaceae bacterium]
MKRLMVKTMVVALVAAMSASCNKQSSGEMPAANYETMTVKKSDKTVSESYSATIRGRQDVEILPQVSGKIERMCVSEGDVVQKGTVLFVIDQVPYRAALKTAQANVEVAEAALRTAELNLNNSRVLYEKKVISYSNLQTVENSYASAKAQMAQAEAMLVNARNDLSYTEVKSPCAGVVGTLPYRVGALVGPSLPQPLTTISDNSRMYVYFSMTENRLLALTRQYGSMDGVIKNMPEVQLKLSDGSIYEQTGRIESISGVIDRQTGSVTARAEFVNAGRVLHSGASGAVVIPSVYKDVIVIPQEATVKMQDKVMVYLVAEGGVAKSTLIEVSAINDGREYVVLSGLNPGDEIVSAGAGLVREGTKVK